MKLCPKCIGGFVPEYEWCDKHLAEYQQWLTNDYTPKDCECHENNWESGHLQMTNPATQPLMKVWRCSKCKEVRLEVSKDGTVRIIQRDVDA